MQWIAGLFVIASLSLKGKDLDQIFSFLDPDGYFNSTTLKIIAIIILAYNSFNQGLNIVLSLYRLICLFDLDIIIKTKNRLIPLINNSNNNLLVTHMSKSENNFFIFGWLLHFSAEIVSDLTRIIIWIIIIDHYLTQIGQDKIFNIDGHIYDYFFPSFSYLLKYSYALFFSFFQHSSFLF